MDFNITVKTDPFVTIRKCKLCDNHLEGQTNRTTCSAKCRVKMNRWKKEGRPIKRENNWNPTQEEWRKFQEWKQKYKPHLKLIAR
tara:strand:+ start:22 stop:276 length:255 start_codon:yes stop_codon:yes gene_type:complete